MTYVGSHQGCGCGFNSGDLAWQGIHDVADATALLAAMPFALLTAASKPT